MAYVVRRAFPSIIMALYRLRSVRQCDTTLIGIASRAAMSAGPIGPPSCLMQRQTISRLVMVSVYDRSHGFGQ
jgi:hypothetical protein